MTFTYGNLNTPVEEVRFLVGDVVEGAGVRPDERNFSDEEITYLLSKAEGSVQKAYARALRILASEWARIADTTIGPRKENFSQISKRYESMAQSAEEALGIDSTTFTVGLIRRDGYASENSVSS